MESSFDYLRAHAVELGSRILETYPPLQSTKDPVAPSLATLLRKALPAQALAVTGTAKYLRRAKAARIVAECGAGKTFMALGTIHVLAEGRASSTLVMCPSHITHKWAREVLLTIPRARAFLIEDMRNGGDPSRPHGICEVKLSKGKTVYEGKRLSLAEMRRMGRKEWRKRFPGPTFFITGKDKGKLGYFWEHVYLKAKSGPNLGGVVNPDSGIAILDSEMQKLTALDFTDKLKVSEALTAPRGGTTRFSALWQADRSRIQRMAPIEYVGRYMRGWFDFAIADELHQLAGDTAQGNGRLMGTIVSPAEPIGTMKYETPCGSPRAPDVRASRAPKSAPVAPKVQIFCPLMRKPSVVRSARVAIIARSDPASGSLCSRHHRSLPSSSGHR